MELRWRGFHMLLVFSYKQQQLTFVCKKDCPTTHHREHPNANPRHTKNDGVGFSSGACPAGRVAISPTPAPNTYTA